MAGTVIGPGTHLESGLRGKDDITIEGRVDGQIVGEGTIILAQGAEVHGDVWGHEVTIGCVLKHKVQANFAVHLLATAEVYGDVTAPRITVEDGAVLEGQVKITRQAPAQQKEQARADDRRSSGSPMRQTPPPARAATKATAAPPARREIPQLPVLGRRAATRRKA
jgi:cytoskeletal protein CcmA (bactofilin family)